MLGADERRRRRAAARHASCAARPERADGALGRLRAGSLWPAHAEPLRPASADASTRPRWSRPPQPRTRRAVAGPVRLGRKTKLLVKRLRPGDIAVIDHRDLDRVSAEDLIAAGVGGGAQLPRLVHRRLPEHGAAAARAGRHPARRPARRRALRGAQGRRPGRAPRRRGAGVRGERWSRGELRRSPQRGPARRPTSAARRSARRSRRSRATPSSTWSRSATCWPGKIELPRFDTDFRDRPGAGRRARRRPPARPAGAAALHPRRAPGARRRRRRRQRAARGGLQAGHDRRRHGLGGRGDAALRRRARRARLPRRPRAGPRAPRGARAAVQGRARRPGRARTSRC